MEDRHVLLHDLKAYMPSHLQDKISADQHISFYAGKLASSVWTNEGSVNLPS